MVPIGDEEAFQLRNLGIRHYMEFQRSGQISDLQAAGSLHRELRVRLPTHHPDRALSLNILAGVLGDQFQRTSQYADLEEEIMLHHELLELFPNTNRSRSLYNLANLIFTRFRVTGQQVDLN